MSLEEKLDALIEDNEDEEVEAEEVEGDAGEEPAEPNDEGEHEGEFNQHDFLEKLMDSINCPKTAADIGIDEAIVPMSFVTAKDIRDKYVLPRLAWDLGIAEELI